jgi:glycosyltransferase involved in cell wall biosynthesis
MRVAIFTDSWFPRVDGLTTSVKGFMTHLEARGHSFHVFAPGPRREVTSEVTWFKGLPFWGYPDFHIALREGQHDTVRMLKEGGFDVVHIQSPFLVGYWGLRAARKAGIPVVTSYHTYLPDLVPYVLPPGLRAPLRRFVWRFTGRFFERSQAILVPSPSCKAELARHLRKYRFPEMEVHSNGVDLQRFHPAKASAAMRARLGPPGSRVLLSVGRLAREKDLPFLAQAFHDARKVDPRLHLALGGKGPDLKRVQAKVKQLGMQEHVTFLGFVPDEELAALYASADAFASASQFETQGMTAVEAMACGIPVAAVRARGLADYVADGRTGHLFEPGDVQGASEAILRCIQADPAMRKAARRHAETLDLQRSVDQLEAVYERLAGRTKPTSVLAAMPA